MTNKLLPRWIIDNIMEPSGPRAFVDASWNANKKDQKNEDCTGFDISVSFK